MRIHRYHRATGTPLPDELGLAEFMAAFEAAGRARRLPGAPCAVEWLIRQY